MTTPTQARTANEQRIDALEAEVVTMRGALERAKEYFGRADYPPHCVEHVRASDIAVALSPSDYSTKVVVEREEWEAMNDCLGTVVSGSYYSGAYTKALDRLNSIRQGGGG